MASRLDRRCFLNRMARSCLGVATLPFMSGASWANVERQIAANGGRKPAKHVIFLFMMGGQSHIDTWDPKPGAESQGPLEAVRTSVAGIQLSSHLGRVAKHMDELAIVRSLTSKEGSHPRGQYQLHTNYPPLGTVKHPSMGAWILKEAGRLNASLPGNVTIGGRAAYGAGFFGSAQEPFMVNRADQGLSNLERPAGVTRERQDARLKLMDDLDSDFRTRFPDESVAAYTRYYAEAVKMMYSDDVRAFDLDREPDTMRQRYGDDPFGRGLLLARRLVQSGVRFVEVAYNGWDTHQDNFERVEELSDPLDRGLSALIQDLKSTGLLDETLIVVATEFGRTPRINGQGGRDHYPRAFSAAFAGGGIRGGQVFGKTDSAGARVVDSPVTLADVNATIAHAMGLDPQLEVRSPAGRPFKMCADGEPIRALFS